MTHERCTSRAHTWFASPHVWCTGTVTIANEMYLFCSLSVSLYVVIIVFAVYEIYGHVLVENIP